MIWYDPLTWVPDALVLYVPFRLAQTRSSVSPLGHSFRERLRDGTFHNLRPVTITFPPLGRFWYSLLQMRSVPYTIYSKAEVYSGNISLI